jgi:hypothetical protein
MLTVMEFVRTMVRSRDRLDGSKSRGVSTIRLCDTEQLDVWQLPQLGIKITVDWLRFI